MKPSVVIVRQLYCLPQTKSPTQRRKVLRINIFSSVYLYLYSLFYYSSDLFVRLYSHAWKSLPSTLECCQVSFVCLFIRFHHQWMHNCDAAWQLCDRNVHVFVITQPNKHWSELGEHTRPGALAALHGFDSQVKQHKSPAEEQGGQNKTEELQQQVPERYGGIFCVFVCFLFFVPLRRRSSSCGAPHASSLLLAKPVHWLFSFLHNRSPTGGPTINKSNM